jgi:hypothetical protein
MVKTGTTLLAETVELGVVQDLVEAFIERVTWCAGQLAAVPQLLLSLSHLPRAHRHTQILKSKHFHVQAFFRVQTQASSLLSQK